MWIRCGSGSRLIQNTTPLTVAQLNEFLTAIAQGERTGHCIEKKKKTRADSLPVTLVL
jgi:hypothetical protein